MTCWLPTPVTPILVMSLATGLCVWQDQLHTVVAPVPMIVPLCCIDGMMPYWGPFSCIGYLDKIRMPTEQQVH